MATSLDENRIELQTEVVIVGAGLSGLAAARSLHQRGVEVLVLEASDRVGGRVNSATVQGAHVDLGGTFVGPGQDRIAALAEEVGVEARDTHDAGASVIRWRGETRPYQGSIPSIGTIGLIDIARIRRAIDKLAASVPLGRPWAAQKAQALDGHSLESWLRARHAGRSSHDLLAIVCKTTWGCEPSEISMLHVAHYIHQCGGLNQMLDTHGGAQEQHFVQGAYEIARRMADDLGGRLRLGEPVRSVTWTEDGVVVQTPTYSVSARRAIVAVPPALRQRISFSPELSSGYRYLAQRWTAGVLSKAYVTYDRPFWRAQGLSGQSVSDSGPVFITFDASPDDESAGVILGFIGGNYARRWDGLPEAERRLRVLSCLVDLFGPDAGNATGYTDQRWGEESWVGGGPTAAPSPGAVAPYARFLTQPIGSLHWAGTECSVVWAGFMEGAVRSGERAAREAYGAIRFGDRQAASLEVGVPA